MMFGVSRWVHCASARTVATAATESAAAVPMTRAKPIPDIAAPEMEKAFHMDGGARGVPRVSWSPLVKESDESTHGNASTGPACHIFHLFLLDGHHNVANLRRYGQRISPLPAARSFMLSAASPGVRRACPPRPAAESPSDHGACGAQ